MASDALVAFQQTTRSRGSRRFKLYRASEFDSIETLLDRFDRYLRRNRFPREVTRPHWLDTEGAVFEGTLSKFGEKFNPLSTFNVLVVTSRSVEPFLAVPMSMDVVPVVANGLRVTVYDATDCPDATPEPDATPLASVNEASFDWPLDGPVGAEGPIERWHTFLLQAGRKLARTNTDGDGAPTRHVACGDRVLSVELRARRPFGRLAGDGVFVNYGHEAAPDGDFDDRVARIHRQTAQARYRYARHLWGLRHGERPPEFANDPDDYAEEREGTAAHFLMDMLGTYGQAVAPFSADVYGGLLRKDTATRADTFSLNRDPRFERDEVVRELSDADPAYDPEYDHSLR